MATYAIGDVQGCFSALRRLLDVFHFDRTKDCLWFVGDLVNRGPDSAAVLRFVRDLGDSAVMVLGNHDLHALALAAGLTRRRGKDSLDDLLSDPDREELLGWLRQRPLLHQQDRVVLVHAGLLPSWTAGDAGQHAREVEQVLRSRDYPRLLRALYSRDAKDLQWSENLSGLPRLCAITNALTRLRACTREGDMVLSFKGAPDQIPDGLVPWFRVPDRKSADSFVICGHWSTMGLYVRENLAALDTGCIWGGRLSAIRLEDRQVFQVRCAEAIRHV